MSAPTPDTPLGDARGESSPPDASSLRWLQVGAASLWLLTAAGVLHPYYRQVGEAWLGRLGLPPWCMWLACAGELVLGVLVLTLRPRRWLTALQLSVVAGFTLTLASLEPMLLVHPFGVLTKNVPFCAVVLAVHLASRDGLGPPACRVLRVGVATVWLTEGLFPKILFQQPLELAVVADSGLVPFSPAVFLVLLGVAQAASGVAVLALRGRWLALVLGAQAVALVVLPVLVSRFDAMLWFHPFGPLTKNLPILVGTLVILRRCLHSSSR